MGRDSGWKGPFPARRNRDANVPFLLLLENVFSFAFRELGCISIRDTVAIRLSLLARKAVREARGRGGFFPAGGSAARETAAPGTRASFGGDCDGACWLMSFTASLKW